MKRIMVTGACGFVFSHVVEHLLKNTDWEIVVVDRLDYASNGFDRLRDIECFDPERVAVFTHDLNTPIAVKELHALRSLGRMTELARSLSFLGLFNPSLFGPKRNRILSSDITPENRRKIEQWIAARTTARSARNWAESDRIRDELAAMGVKLKDNKDGTTTWEVAR